MRNLFKNVIGIVFMAALLASCSQPNPQVETPTQLHQSVSSETPNNPTLTPGITPFESQTTLSAHTPESTLQAKEAIPLLNSRYIVINDQNQAVFLVDFHSSQPRQFISDEVDPLRVIDIHPSGCELIVKLWDHSIVRVNLQAQVIQELLPVNWYSGIGAVGDEIFSSSGEWIAYIVGTGNQGYNSYEYQDVEIMNLADRTAIQMTANGGAWEVSWSQEGTWFAFSDFDENGVNQIYIAHAGGQEKYQLTDFHEEELRIILLRWSPDNAKLAFQSYNERDRHTSFGVIFIEGNNGDVKIYPEVFSGVRNLWWDDDTTLVIHLISHGEAISEDTESIIWLNTITGQIIGTLLESKTPDQTIRSANYFDRGVVGFFSDKSFFTYDMNTKTFLRYFDNFLNYSEWFTAPATFPGEQNCPNP